MATLNETSEQDIATRESPSTEPETIELLSRTSSQSAQDTPFTSTAAAPYPSPSTFHPTHNLLIQAHGIQVIHPLGPHNELEIPILDASAPHTPTPVFTAVRPSARSASCTLHNAAGAIVARTSDRLSNLPLRTIVISLDAASAGDARVEMKRKALLTRACVFRALGWAWEWRYGRREEGGGRDGRALLVLERGRAGPGPGGGDGDGDGDVSGMVRVAQLVRDREGRVEGAGATTVGHGGRLEMDFGKKEGEAEGESGRLEVVQALVVMTCLVMLKKEVDRRRNFHPVPISAVFSKT